MIDPVSALALATAAFNGIKKAVEVGREISDIYGQLSSWAGHMSDLQECISQAETKQKEPGLFDKIGFSKSATSEAFDMIVAKQKVKEMEEEIRHMFLYGDLQHLGMDGLREFYQMRRNIKEEREKMIYEQARRRKEFFELIKMVGIIGFIVLAGGSIIWWMIDFTITMGQEAGKW
jgi:hypothetical protein